MRRHEQKHSLNKTALLLTSVAFGGPTRTEEEEEEEEDVEVLIVLVLVFCVDLSKSYPSVIGLVPMPQQQRRHKATVDVHNTTLRLAAFSHAS